MITRAPCRARPVAVAAPKPVAAPVMRILRPSKPAITCSPCAVSEAGDPAPLLFDLYSRQITTAPLSGAGFGDARAYTDREATNDTGRTRPYQPIYFPSISPGCLRTS